MSSVVGQYQNLNYYTIKKIEFGFDENEVIVLNNANRDKILKFLDKSSDSFYLFLKLFAEDEITLIYKNGYDNWQLEGIYINKVKISWRDKPAGLKINSLAIPEKIDKNNSE